MDVVTPGPVPVADIETPAEAEFFPPPRRARGPSLWVANLRHDARELVRFWPVIQNMVVQEIRVRYQRSFLGFLWTMLHPILMMTTLTMVFSRLFHLKQANYAIYLFAGMVPWGFLAASLNECAFSIIYAEGLIRKIYLPKLIFPLAKLLVNLVTFLLSLAAMFLLLKPLGVPLSPSMVMLPVVTALFALFILGLGLVVAVANTFFRDTGHLVTVLLQVWYFATPIVYPLSQMPEEYHWRFRLNPVYPFIRMFQVILVDGAWPGLDLIVASAAIAAASLGIGYAAFKSHEDKLVFRL